MGVNLGQVECCRGRGLSEFIVHKTVEFLDHGLHQVLFFAQVKLKRFYQIDGHEAIIGRLGQYQGGCGGKITGPGGSGGSCSGIDGNDLPEFFQVGFPIVACLQDAGNFVAHLQIQIHRLREIPHIPLVNLERTDAVAILYVQFRCNQKGIPPNLVVFGFRFDAFVFPGSQGELAVLPVDIGDFLGHFGLKRVSGKGVAESHQYGGCHVPILELDQGCGAIVFGVGSDCRGWRHATHPQKMIGSNPVLLGGVGQLTLLVNRRGQVVDQAIACLVAFRQQGQYLQVGAFGLSVVLELIRRMGGNQPGRAQHIHFCIGVALDEFPGSGQGLFVFIHGVEILHGRSEDDGRLLMLREVIDKFQRAADNISFDGILSGRRNGGKMLPVGVDGSIAGFGSFFVRRVVVGGLLIFNGRFTEDPVFQKQIRQLVIDDRRFALGRERVQKLTIPVQRLFEMGRFLFLFAWVLVAGMIMIGQVDQVDFQVIQNVLTGIRFEVFPVIRLQAVCRGKCLFGIQHQAGKATGGIDLDDPHVKIRRHLVEGIAAGEGVVSSTGIGVTAFVKVEFAQVAVNPFFITALAVPGKVIHNGIGAAEVGKV